MTQGRAWLGRLVAAAFVLAAGRTALGHGSLDSNVSGTLRPTGLDLQLYLSRYSAALLIEQPGAPLTITRATFPAAEARLAAAAPSFVAVTAGGGGDAPGGTLAADASAVTLTDEDDVCLRLHYPAPAGGRLGVFARKPAPVQASWLNYVQTTGLTAVDYLIHCDCLKVPGAQDHCAETLWYLGATISPFRPDPRPEPMPTPALAQGYVTFGSYNHPARLNDQTVAAWSAILNGVPGSRLILRLESQLQNVIQDPMAVYQALKVYMMLGGVAPQTSADFIVAWEKQDWQTLYPGPQNQSARDRLEAHLRAMLALNEGHRPTFELKGILVDSAQKTLTRLSIADQAYAYMKTLTPDVPIEDFNVAQRAGPESDAVFETVDGSGQRGLVSLVTGARQPTAGTISWDGASVAGLDTAGLRAKGLAHLPADRFSDGGARRLSVAENAVAGAHRLAKFRFGPFLRRNAMRAYADEVIAAYNVRAPGAAAPSAPHVIPQAGRARWRLTLTRSRYGTTGSWIVEAPDAQGHLHLPASLADRSAAQTDGVIRRTG